MECGYVYSNSWGGGCNYPPSIKQYVSDDCACVYDDVVTFSDEEEEQIREAIRNDDDTVVQIIDEVVDDLVDFNDFCGDEQDRRCNIFDYIMDHYEKEGG
jgi:hypothetical protein